jgi:hypothetical protein
MTPSTKPVTRLTSAWVRDQGMRLIVATITGSLIELRAKGRRQTEALDISALYTQAVKARVIAERKAKKAERSARRGGR